MRRLLVVLAMALACGPLAPEEETPAPAPASPAPYTGPASYYCSVSVRCGDASPVQGATIVCASNVTEAKEKAKASACGGCTCSPLCQLDAPRC